MSAHLHCAHCGRCAWRWLSVEVGADGVARCNGSDCAEWTARLHHRRDPIELRPIIHQETPRVVS